MKTPEWHEKQAIKEFLNKIGPEHCWYFLPMMNGYGKSGVPDIIGSLYGTCFGVEVKRPGNQPTVIQKKRMSEMSRTNALAVAGTAEVVIQALKDWLAVRGVVV